MKKNEVNMDPADSIVMFDEEGTRYLPYNYSYIYRTLPQDEHFIANLQLQICNEIERSVIGIKKHGSITFMPPSLKDPLYSELITLKTDIMEIIMQKLSNVLIY